MSDTPAETTPHALAETALRQVGRNATKRELGKALIDLMVKAKSRLCNEWRQEREFNSAGKFVTGIRSRQDQENKLVPSISYDGRPMTKGISDHGQMRLWYEVPPATWCNLALREQQVVDGRHQSNIVRLKLAEMLKGRPDLMGLPTIGDVLKALRLPLDGYEIPDAEEA